MYNFDGIKPEALDLLAINEFNDSKSFYDEHKEELKELATVPMRKIVLDVSELLYEVDDLMYTNPNMIVSRIRRDTRRSTNKTMYRANLWVMFRRYKKKYPSAPFMWFEFSPEGYNYGIGQWVQKPAQFDEIRELIMEEPDRFRMALCPLQENYVFQSEQYKNDRIPESADDLKKYINSKYLVWSHYSSDLKKLGNTDIVDEIMEHIKRCAPMYQFLIEAYDNAYKKGLLKFYE